MGVAGHVLQTARLVLDEANGLPGGAIEMVLQQREIPGHRVVRRSYTRHGEVVAG
jgi:uncharacterized protein (UPF0248 family)